MSYPVTPGTVYFIGAGPGAPDLITVRGRDIIARADLILYADSLVDEAVPAAYARPTARVIGSAGLDLERIVALMVETARASGVVARVHTGDPSLYGAIHEQMAALDAQGVPYEIVPGVTAAFAAAARLGVELTVPEVTQTFIVSRVAGRTPVPPGEALHDLAAHGASLALYLSVAQIEQVVAELLAGGAYVPDTPVAVVYRATWPDERVITGTLANIAPQVREAGLTRHALILVGPALGAARPATRSRLYASEFAHGYRRQTTTGATPEPAEAPHTVVIAVTRAGARLAARLAPELGATAHVPAKLATEAPGATTYTGPARDLVRTLWGRARALVLVMATGIAVRAVAPLLTHKGVDPAVICLDEAGRAVVPLLGGHRAGANDLARRIAAFTGGQPAITTASDTQGLPALDRLGQEAGWRIVENAALTHAMACLVNGEPLGCYVDPALPRQRRQIETWLAACPDLTFVDDPADLANPRFAAALLLSQRALSEHWPALRDRTVRYAPPVLVAGIGCRRGVPVEELRAALDTALADADLDPRYLAALATAALKADEPGLKALAEERGLPLVIVPDARLQALDPTDFSPSAAGSHADLPGVAEPCAVVVAGGPLLVPKRAFARCTVAVALRPDTSAWPEFVTSTAPQLHTSSSSPSPGRLTLVSIGPGDLSQLTLAARQALQEAEVVVGYGVYVELVRPLLAPHQEVLITPAMGDELGRARQALDLARAGRRVALISSGDIGIYAMAAPVFEHLRSEGWDGMRPSVEVLPGISAFQALAARLGAPISHDFSVISLSDLLTPWEVIERRVAAAAAADCVVALYNPRSRERHWHLGAALTILRAHRPPQTPVALGRNVMRADERIILTTLAEVDPAQADMFTVVLVGNSQSYPLAGRLVTPRGYEARTRPASTLPHPHTSTPPHLHTPTPPCPYPIVLTNLSGAPVVVVGGGPVGERKVRGLLETGARVRLISPEASPQLRAWAAAGRIVWQPRAYAPGDLAGARLVFAATGEREVNARVARDAALHGALCNVADAPEEGDFHLPALHRSGEMTIAVSSGGAAPGRSAALRDAIAAWLEAGSPNGQPGGAPPPAEVAPAPDRRPAAAMPRGKAYLVGAGPGRADLITLRGLTLLRRADVVLYDWLVAPELLAQVPAGAELIFVGKTHDRHTLEQDAITDLLVAHARAGRQVVRLKGGDPGVFGHAGEEALALARAGLPFEIVPGVSSALAAPAYAGIPLTFRGLASGFAVVTGHEAPNTPHHLDWAALARVPTLVVLMGLHRTEAICAALREAGRAPDTPVAVISRATTSEQRVLRATLEGLPAALQAHPLPTPAVLVIGDVVALADELTWFAPELAAEHFVPFDEAARHAHLSDRSNP
jgi:cobalt-precorrin 5A hydrolase/precorrin-3B C17-methyltransferase